MEDLEETIMDNLGKAKMLKFKQKQRSLNKQHTIFDKLVGLFIKQNTLKEQVIYPFTYAQVEEFRHFENCNVYTCPDNYKAEHKVDIIVELRPDKDHADTITAIYLN